MQAALRAAYAHLEHFANTNWQKIHDHRTCTPSVLMARQIEYQRVTNTTHTTPSNQREHNGLHDWREFFEPRMTTLDIQKTDEALKVGLTKAIKTEKDALTPNAIDNILHCTNIDLYDKCLGNDWENMRKRKRSKYDMNGMISSMCSQAGFGRPPRVGDMIETLAEEELGEKCTVQVMTMEKCKALTKSNRTPTLDVSYARRKV